MKSIRLLLTIAWLLPLAQTQAQDEVNKKQITYINYPFTKGKSGYQLEKNIGYRHRNEFFDDDEIGHTTDLSVSLDWKKFVADGVGIGFDFKADWAGDFNGTDTKNRDWRLYGNLTWGKALGTNSNLYIELGAGYGRNKTIVESISGTTENVSNVFGARLELGLPLNVGNANNFVTPQLFVQYYNENFDDGKEKTTQFGAAVILEGYTHPREKISDCQNGYPLSKSLYQQGTSYLGYYSKGMFSVSDSKLTIDNISGEQETDYNRGHLKATYGVYVTDYVAVGLGVNLSSRVEELKTNDLRYEWTAMGVMPHVLMNIPVDNGWNNFFIQLEGGIGTRKFEFDFSGNVTETKYNTTSLGASLGYNLQYTPGLALTARLGYDWQSSKQDDSDQKEKFRGISAEIGATAYFGRNVKWTW